MKSDLKKKNGGLKLGITGLNMAQSEVFCHFVEFGSYFSLEIAYSNSWRQLLTSSRGKT